jgi:uncharacterized membrane protein YesL
MRRNDAGLDRILALSVRQAFQRIAFWLRVNIWHVLTGVLILTLPVSAAALYHTVRAGLLDPFEVRVSIRTDFALGMRLHFRRSYELTGLNLAALGAIVLAVAFWFTRDAPLQYVTAIALAFFAFWWLCQPFLFPMLVEHPDLAVVTIIKMTARLVIQSPAVAFAVAMAHSAIALVTVLLMGPSLLFAPTFAALIGIQAMWSMTGVSIPDFEVAPAEN